MNDFVNRKLKSMKWNPIVSFRMPKEFYSEFEEYCEKNYFQKSKIILLALDQYFKEHIRKP